MNRLSYFLTICLLIGTHMLNSDESTAPTHQTVIPFSYANEDIINIINYIVGLLGKNVLLPQGGNAINIKLTYSADREYTPEQAWDLVLSFLDLAGYSVIEKDDTYHILKSNKEIAREGLPVYIGAAINSIRDDDLRIVYIHYFANLQAGSEGLGEVQEILRAILPEDAKYVTDQGKNSVIIAAKAHDISNLISILERLDVTEYKEKIDFLKLRYASAPIVADLFNQYFLAPEDPNVKFRLDTRKKESNYFAPHTRIIAYERTNALIIIGNQQGIDRIRDFITEYIDIPSDIGESILHVYPLQYLDAEEFAPVLQKIVEPNPSTTGQSRTEGKRPTGPERFFDEVIITVDKPKNAQDLKYYGGNNLVIACRNDDWGVIKDIIERLDLPRDQVFIEILVADLTVEDQRMLGTVMRNPASIPLINTTEFQSAQLDPGVLLSNIIVDPTTGVATVNPTTNVNADLLSVPPVTTPQTVLNPPTTSPPASSGGDMLPGSTAISFNDNNGTTWTIAQILQFFSHTKILSHPHMVATHNKETTFMNGQYRLVQGDVTGSVGSNTVAKLEPITADLKIYVTPRISGANTVNLDIKIDIEEFVADSNAKNTRNVKTNANVLSESVLALGGLISTQTTQGKNQTPFLGDIPILGWFFKSRSGDLLKNNLTVFISPTIVHARLRKGIGQYTQDHIALAEQYSAESLLFDTIKDPITRLFFPSTNDTYAHEIKEFTEIDEFVREETLVPMPAKTVVKQQKEKQQEKQYEDEDEDEEVDEKHDYVEDKTFMSEAQKPVAKTKHASKKKQRAKPASLLTASQQQSCEQLKELLPEESPFIGI